MRKLVLAAAATAALAVASGAQAATTLVNTSCNLSTGCLFDDPGPGGANDSEAELEAAYNAVFGAGALNLVSLGSSSKVEFSGGDQFDGTWTWSGSTPVAFISVKAANQVMLYQIDPAAFSGTWTTAGLLNNGGNQPGISHYTLWGGTVDDGDIIGAPGIPEPSTWALMIAGFGAVGAGLRRRGRTAVA